MAKSKGSRIGLSLKCTMCENQSTNENKMKYIDSTKTKKKNTYRTTKNRKNNPSRLELKKFCRLCNSHTMYKEMK